MPYVLFGGPALFLALACGLVALRFWLRSRIQPNETFPAAPQLPFGTPPALLANEERNEFRLAKPDDGRIAVPAEWHDFQIGRHSLPPLCCGCLQPSGLQHAYRLLLDTALHLDIPRCAGCARKDRRLYRRLWCIVAATGVLVVGPVLWLLRLEAAEFWTLFGGLSLICMAVGAVPASMATKPVTTAAGDHSRGVLRLRFRNYDYHLAVAKHLSEGSNAVFPPQEND